MRFAHSTLLQLRLRADATLRSGLPFSFSDTANASTQAKFELSDPTSIAFLDEAARGTPTRLHKGGHHPRIQISETRVHPPKGSSAGLPHHRKCR